MTAANPPQHRALVYARDITDTMIRERRMVAAGTVQGQLIATTAVNDQVVLTLLVGDPAVRAFVPVGAGDAVETWKAPK